MPFKPSAVDYLPGRPGEVATIQFLKFRTQNPIQNQAGEEILFGTAVKFDATAKKLIKPAATTDKILGVACRPSEWAIPNENYNLEKYGIGDYVVLTDLTDVWGLVAVDVKANEPVAVIATGAAAGQFTNSATGTIATKAFFLTDSIAYGSLKIARLGVNNFV